VVTASPSGRGRELTEFLVAAGFTPDAVAEREEGLEEVFLRLTGNTRNVGARRASPSSEGNVGARRASPSSGTTEEEEDR
jgi:hypothetical protein